MPTPKFAIGLCAVLTVAAPASAQEASRDARIAALQAQLNAIQAELNALHQSAPEAQTAKPVAVPAQPTTASTAGLSQSAGGGAKAAGNSTQVFGPGKPSTAAVARIDAGKPVIATSDGRFSANLIAVMQFDVGDYFQHDAGPLTTDFRRGGAATDAARARSLADGSTFRRARLGLGGRAFGDFEYSVLLDFGGSGLEDSAHVQELWLQYSGLKPAHIRVGAFAPSLGLADAGSTNGMAFLERPAIADLARSLAGGDFREAGQIVLNGPRWFVSGAVSGRLVNTAGSSAVQPYKGQLGLIGRAAALAVKSTDATVHIGAHGSYVAHPANVAGPDAVAGAVLTPVQFRERPELRVDGTRLIDTGAIDASHAYTAGLELAARYRNLLIQGEYERLGVERRASALSNPHFSGFYVEGSWVLTGEPRRYNDGNFAFDGPKVDRSINPMAGQWGAWELAVRYSKADLNDDAGTAGSATPVGGVRGGDQKILSAGVNWYLNSIARVMFDYQHVDISRLSPNPITYQTPLGAQIGQSYSAGAMRFQLAF